MFITRRSPESIAASARSATEPSIPTESLALYVLLDFLTGDSIEDVVKRHHLQSTRDAEQLLRVVLLQHGFTVN